MTPHYKPNLNHFESTLQCESNHKHREIPHSNSSPYRNQVRLITSCRRIGTCRWFRFGLRQKGISFLLGVFSSLTVPQMFCCFSWTSAYPYKPIGPQTLKNPVLPQITNFWQNPQNKNSLNKKTFGGFGRQTQFPSFTFFHMSKSVSLLKYTWVDWWAPRSQKTNKKHKWKNPGLSGFEDERNSSWWLNQPIWKNMSQNGNLPQIGVKIKEDLKPTTQNSLHI